MTNRVMILALLLILICPLGCTHAIDRHEAGIVPPDVPIHDKEQADACDCCQKCKAAKSSVKSERQETGSESDGCEDCCTRCGKVLQPSRQDTPPEVIEKHVPDIKEKPQ